jgi:hypothetical protein
MALFSSKKLIQQRKKRVPMIGDGYKLPPKDQRPPPYVPERPKTPTDEVGRKRPLPKKRKGPGKFRFGRRLRKILKKRMRQRRKDVQKAAPKKGGLIKKSPYSNITDVAWKNMAKRRKRTKK